MSRSPLENKKANFYENVVIKINHKNRESTYFTAKYKDETYDFCISSHHGAYRGTLPCFISSKKTIQRAKGFCWDLINYFDEFKTRNKYKKQIKY